ncbi:MAG: TatD family hydrolase [Oligoflexia bacterium]|nr:TatD family hydrolase [Oligoflexia bacterium]
MKVKLIDTHCHLNSLKSRTVEEALRLAKENHVTEIITIATSVDDQNEALNLAQTHQEVFATQGVHPHEAVKFTNDILDLMKKNFIKFQKKILAIGEIGLDYYYDFSPRKNQIEVFEKQLQLALDLNLPVVIHSRDADNDMMDVIKNFSNARKLIGVFHSYSSGLKLAQKALEQGFYLGYNGMITFNKADNVREILAITPIQNILLETDAPYLAPVPHRGKENAPHLVQVVAQKAAELKKIPLEDFAKITYENANRLFSFI